MNQYEELINLLTKELDRFHYERKDDDSISHVGYISYVVNPHPLKVRNLCAFIELPDSIKEQYAAKNFFNTIRNSLLLKYGNAFLWKELEMCFIVACEHDLYQLFKNDGGRVVAHEGFSLNAMMGTCFIDKSNYDHFHQSTWGLYFSGEHFKVVSDAVDQWCARRKEKTASVNDQNRDHS